MNTTSVVANLYRNVGTWHDHLRAFHPDGTEMFDDPHGSMPGPFPFDNLVYVNFDGENYRQTNVTFRGREVAERNFTAKVVGGILRFDNLGPNDPGHVGVSGGDGILVFCSNRTNAPGLHNYAEPDYVRIEPGQRSRTTTLYRGGELVRVMTAFGTRLSATADVRHPLDPRGRDGEVHGDRSVTNVYEEKK